MDHALPGVLTAHQVRTIKPQGLHDVTVEDLANAAPPQPLNQERQHYIVGAGVSKLFRALAGPRRAGSGGQAVRMAHRPGHEFVEGGNPAQGVPVFRNSGPVVQYAAHGDRSRRTEYSPDFRKILGDGVIQLHLPFLHQLHDRNGHHGFRDVANLDLVGELDPLLALVAADANGRGPFTGPCLDLHDDGGGATRLQVVCVALQHADERRLLRGLRRDGPRGRGLFLRRTRSRCAPDERGNQGRCRCHGGKPEEDLTADDCPHVGRLRTGVRRFGGPDAGPCRPRKSSGVACLDPFDILKNAPEVQAEGAVGVGQVVGFQGVHHCGVLLDQR